MISYFIRKEITQKKQFFKNPLVSIHMQNKPHEIYNKNVEELSTTAMTV